jgi:inorganic pyrophosphatase
MADFNKILNPGDIEAGIINVINEIPKGSKLKIEWNRKLAIFELDRVEPGIFAKPCNYGFIPQTLDDDGDELDVLLIVDDSIPTGVKVNAKIVGVLEFEDDAEMDHKIVCVAEDDRHWGDKIEDINDVSQVWKDQIEHHFNHYKDLKKPGSTKVLGWGDVVKAKQIIRECAERWNSDNS